jgi:hypothetical protein
MSKRNISLLCAVAMIAAASLASAQNADRNTAGPTKNDLQLRLTEPSAGQTITGSTIRVTVAYNRQVFGQGQGTRFGEPNFPQARFDVYLDNKLVQTLKAGEANVATISDVPPGPHSIAVVAKNASNEIIDRQEVKVTNVAAVASTETGTSATAPATQPSTEYSSNPPTTSERSNMNEQPPAAGSTASTTAETTASNTPSNLPRTASRAPLAGALGLGLLAAGLLVSRKAR